jgi:prepilin-type processing-associated H-X9-DG protein
VVIAIIAILAAMLLPALTKAKDRAKTAACASNLKQLGLLIRVYSDDSNGFLPVYAPENGCLGYYSPQWYMIYKYLMPPLPLWRDLLTLGRTQKVFDCPATTKPACFCGASSQPNDPTAEAYRIEEKVFDFAIVNVKNNMNGNGQYEKLDDMPSSAVLLMDTRDGQAWWTTQTGCTGLTPATWYEIYSTLYVAYHHNNGSNFLFRDGRVEWHKRDDYQPGWQGNPNAQLRSQVINGLATYVAQP